MVAHRQTVEAVRTYLELPSRTALRPSRATPAGAVIAALEPRTAAEYLAAYVRVGGPWGWRDRLAWTTQELDRYLSSKDVRVFALRVDGQFAGFFELKRLDAARVEVMYFGLDRSFIGRGLGGFMLTRAVEEAFALGAERVILNTCTLDAPQALPNYLARGFVIVREERYTTILASAESSASGSPPAAPTPAA
ncbi:MAG TPA: GNAT family N-acetyltransferase [Gemmatimonadaceae bacterium]